MSNGDILHAVRVPCSTSNLGAGVDCLGLALDIWLRAQIVEGDGPPVYLGTLAGFDREEDHAAKAFGRSMPAGHHLAVDSEIPVGRGLGSSGAAIVAGVALAQLVSGGSVDWDEIVELAIRREGHPDNAGAAVFGGLVLYAGYPKKLTFHQTLGVALAIPNLMLSTHETRGILPTHLPRSDAFAQASSAAALLLGLTTGDGDLIRHGMVDSIAVPVRKSFIQGYDDAVQAGIEAGAYGVTLSGAGSALVAVCPIESTAQVAEAVAHTLTSHGNPAQALCPDVVEDGMEVVAGQGWA